MGVFYEFDEVDAFTVGAVGQPGQRTFLLQARRGDDTRHGEVREAAGRGDRRLPAQGDERSPVARRSATARSDGAGRAGGARRSFSARSGWATTATTIVCWCNSRKSYRSTRRASQTQTPSTTAVTSGSSSHAARPRRSCNHTDSIVAAGRPPCQWCGNPIDPDGHACPRMN